MDTHSPRGRLLRALRAGGDLAIAAGSFYGAFLLRIHVPLPLTAKLLPSDRLALATGQWWGVGLAAASQLLLLYLFGFYDPPEPRPRLEIARRKLREADQAGEDRRADLWMRRITELEQQHLALLERIGAVDALRAEMRTEQEQRAAQIDPNAALDHVLRMNGTDPEWLRAVARADAESKFGPEALA